MDVYRYSKNLVTLRNVYYRQDWQWFEEFQLRFVFPVLVNLVLHQCFHCLLFHRHRHHHHHQIIIFYDWPILSTMMMIKANQEKKTEIFFFGNSVGPGEQHNITSMCASFSWFLWIFLFFHHTHINKSGLDRRFA